MDLFQARPWSSGGPDGIQGRAMMLHVLRKANEMGWKLCLSLDVSAKYYKNSNNNISYPLDVHSWFFAKFEPEPSAPQMDFSPPSYEQCFQ